MYTLFRKVLRLSIPVSVLWTAFISLSLSFYANMGGEAIAGYLQRRVSVVGSTQTIAAYDPVQYKTAAPSKFPAFECAIDPFGFTPHYGNMKGLSQLNRPYKEMSAYEFVPPPEYNMSVLTSPLLHLERPPLTAGKKQAITAKLFYSTRFMGEYDLDSPEFVSNHHPAIDFKMPLGTLIRSIAGGRVHRVAFEADGLGHYVIIEHRLPSREKIYSIYGHMQKIIVSEGQDLHVGQTIGTVGNTGHSTLPHLHLQIDRDRGQKVHTVYTAGPNESRAEIAKWTMHPIDFIRNY